MIGDAAGSSDGTPDGLPDGTPAAFAAAGFGLAPLPGGHSGETFLAEAAGERSVVRIYRGGGGGGGPEVGAAVLRLVRGLLPVATVLEVQRARPGSGASGPGASGPGASGPEASSWGASGPGPFDRGTPGLLVTTLLPGSRLDLLLPGLGPEARRAPGGRLGVLLSRLAGMPLPRPGRFADGDLGIVPWPSGDLRGFVEEHRAGTALATWPPEMYDGLLAVADRAQQLLDEVDRTCLVHGDLNPKNLLVDPGTGEVTGLVDWEFAHAGPPGADLGNLLRFERDPAFADAVLEAYRDRVPDAGEDTLDRSRAADLPALVDLASRRGANTVTEQAHDLLVAVARSGDLHAVPSSGA